MNPSCVPEVTGDLLRMRSSASLFLNMAHRTGTSSPRSSKADQVLDYYCIMMFSTKTFLLQVDIIAGASRRTCFFLFFFFFWVLCEKVLLSRLELLLLLLLLWCCCCR